MIVNRGDKVAVSWRPSFVGFARLLAEPLWVFGEEKGREDVGRGGESEAANELGWVNKSFDSCFIILFT